MENFVELFGLIWNPAYSEGEGGEGGGTAVADPAPAAGSGDPAPAAGSGDPAPAAGSGDPAPAAGASTKDKSTFTQAEVNAILAKEKRKNQSQTQKAIDELNALKQKASITSEERKDLDSRIETLQNELLTKEELAKKNAQKTQRTHEKVVTGLTSERDQWKTRYTESTINRSITDAAAEHKAYSPRQIVAILRPNTHLNEVLNTDGEPTGDFEAKVDFNDTDEKGKPVKLTLTVPEAVKRMREIEEYQNLFQGEGAGGLGSMNRSKSGKQPTLTDAAKQGPEAYREARKKGLSL